MPPRKQGGKRTLQNPAKTAEQPSQKPSQKNTKPKRPAASSTLDNQPKRRKASQKQHFEENVDSELELVRLRLREKELDLKLNEKLASNKELRKLREKELEVELRKKELEVELARIQSEKPQASKKALSKITQTAKNNILTELGVKILPKRVAVDPLNVPAFKWKDVPTEAAQTPNIVTFLRCHLQLPPNLDYYDVHSREDFLHIDAGDTYVEYNGKADIVIAPCDSDNFISTSAMVLIELAKPKQFPGKPHVCTAQLVAGQQNSFYRLLCIATDLDKNHIALYYEKKNLIREVRFDSVGKLMGYLAVQLGDYDKLCSHMNDHSAEEIPAELVYLCASKYTQGVTPSLETEDFSSEELVQLKMQSLYRIPEMRHFLHLRHMESETLTPEVLAMYS
eukprot:Colp12_sorted_trinity150504_noHs@12816